MVEGEKLTRKSETKKKWFNQSSNESPDVEVNRIQGRKDFIEGSAISNFANFKKKSV